MEDTPMFNFKIRSRIHDYEVLFINNLEQTLSKEIKKGDFIIIDKNIKNLYHQKLKNILENNPYIVIDATEEQKSYSGLIPIIQTLITDGFKKNHRLIAIGGGITQDVTAFISSIIYRGVSWLFFPTTLLAQGDSCIGSKTSINFEGFKNQLGGFYPPHKIFIYSSFIQTLSDKEMKSGMGEMLHYFIISGKNDFEFYKQHYQDAFNNELVLSKIIGKSLEIKKNYIELDELDQNVRQVFNYGHSFGHAIESLTNYKIPHGIAVAFGMDVANFISVKMGILTPEIRNEIREITQYIWNDFNISNLDVSKFKMALSKDKKNVGTKLGLILTKGYGEVFKDFVDASDEFENWLEDYLKNEV